MHAKELKNAEFSHFWVIWYPSQIVFKVESYYHESAQDLRSQYAKVIPPTH